ncbi:MAG TPA: hypothetical protein VEO01_40515 [Pseudonocardiaceae bacterium]|nr:hypothetical protein [Pseudonocardiaceae bacterium]
MAAFIQGTAQRALHFGNLVKKLAQIPPNSGSSATLFTVAGGMVMVTSMVGRVSTVLSGTTGAVSLGATPTVGAAGAQVAGIAAATVVGGGEVGAAFAVAATIAGAPTTLANGGASGVAGKSPFLAQSAFVVNAGVITVTTSVATMTGAIDWYLTYVPLDDGASVS